MRILILATILFIPLVAAEIGSGKKQINELLFLPFIWLSIAMTYYIFSQKRLSKTNLKIEEESTEIDEGEKVEAGWGEEGFSLTTNWKFRAITLCSLYVAQGIPSGFVTYTLVAYLAAEGYTAAAIGNMLFWVYLPWVFKFLWGPFVDNFHYLPMGRRRPWILGAQFMMIVTVSTIVLIPSIDEKIQLLTALLFVNNVFASLQDVGVDGLAVDILSPEEFGKINGFMFGSQRLGKSIGGVGIGALLGTLGIKGGIFLMIPMLICIMCLPLSIRERPGEKLLPWTEGKAVLNTDDDPKTLYVEKKKDLDYVRFEMNQEKLRKAVLIDVGLLTFLYLFLRLSISDAGISVIGIPLEILLTIMAALTYIIVFYRGSKQTWNSPGMQFSCLSESQSDIIKVLSLKAPLIGILIAMLTYFWEFLIPILSVLFVQDLGWTDAEYIKVTGGYAIWAAMIGTVLGGMISDKFGARRIACLFAVLTGLSIFAIAIAEPYWNNYWIMTFLIILQPTLSAITGIALISLFMNLTWPKVGATQFTMYMALLNFGAIFGLKMAGYFEVNYDYISILMLAGASQFLIAFILPFIDPGETRRTLGEEF